MRICIGIVLLILGADLAVAQRQLVSTVDFEEALVYYRPRIALAENGDYAVSWEALRKLENDEEWQVGLSRFKATGEEIGSSLYLSQATICGSDHSSSNSTGKNNFEERSHVESGIRNADMGFSADGSLVISLEQFLLSLDPETQETQQFSSVKVSVLDQNGEASQNIADLDCEWMETDPIFPDLSSMPRLDVDPQEDILLSTDGHSLRMVPAYSLGGAANKSKITHAALLGTTATGQSNSWVDVATNGWLNASSWQKCSEGLHEQADISCDVEVQFFAELQPGRSQDANPRFVVDQDATGDALNYRPAVAMNASGYSVVVWIDYRNSEYGDIFGQRFDSFGEPIGSNFRISRGNGIIDGEDGSRPEVALLDNGRFLVVWTEHHADGMRAWGRYFESGGNAEADPFLLDPDPTLDSGFPDVASSSEQFAYTWLVEKDGLTSVLVNVPGVTLSQDRTFSLANDALSLKGYPNPFSAETTLEYSLNEAGHVKLVIFDMLGREVKTLIDQLQGPGFYHVRVEADELATGYYVTRLQQGNQQQSRLLVRTE